MVKEAVIFAGGLAVGATAGVLLTKKHYKDIAKKSIDALKETYERKLETSSTPHVFHSEQETRKNDIQLGNTPMTDTGTAMEKELAKKYNKDMIFYNKYSTDKPEEKTDGKEVDSKVSDIFDETIYEISYTELDHGAPGYDKIDVTWYPDPASDAGGILVEDLTDKPISLFDTIGEINRSKNPGDEYYIRNDDIRIDFIVTIGDHPYNV